jgi:hypothetical protein
MYKFFDLLFGFNVRKDDMILKCFLWAVLIFAGCWLLALGISAL